MKLAGVTPKPAWKGRAIAAVIVLLGAAALWYAHSRSSRFPSTDDATIDADVVHVASPVGGRIVRVAVEENARVAQGDVLFEIVDPQRMVIEALSADTGIARKIRAETLVNVPDVELTLLGGARTLRDGAVPINFRARSANLDLAVGQPVTVLAKLDTKVKGIALPAAALARNPANETVVWIKSGAQRFIALPVEATPLDSRTVIVTKGLSPDNRVVVIGTSLINQIR